MYFEVGNYLFSGLSFFLAFSGIAGILISLYIFKFRESPGIVYLSLLQLSTAVWTIFYFLEYSANDLSTRLFWSKFSYVGIASIPVWFYLFSINFASRQKKATSRFWLPLIIVALVFIGIVFTNDSHHLHWRSASIDWKNHTTIYRYGPVFWLIFLFIYSFLALGILNILKLIRRYSNQIHGSIWLMIIACLIPVFGNVMYVFKLNPIPGFDWTPSSFFATGTILAYINIRFGSIDLVPFARQKLIDVMDDGFLLLDVNSRVADINSSLLTLIQQPRDQVVGRHISEVLPEREDLIEQIALNKEISHIEVTTKRSAEKKILDLRATLLYDKYNLLSGQLIILRDITTLKNHEATILATNSKLKVEISENEKLIEDLDNFAHTVAHDLKNSIGAVISLSELIDQEMNEQSYDSVKTFNDVIHTSASKTLYIMEELLTMSTIRQQDIQKEPVDMRLVIDESLKRLSDLIQSSNTSIIKPDRWPVIQAIPSWAEEIWVNFISNAIKYGGAPPVIKLGVEQYYSEGKIKFWIKDNGNGLSKTDQKKLFTEFTRLEASKIQGTGLGLSIVNRIVEKLGGEVGVFSDAIPDEGCLFYFILPIK
ncbi:histidine kinase N-terminal 7TM domain-containing protein [Mangrovibacterium lignilyticum]|uniref:histidine kinase N-terminal 7TM domain-containing protein n=1 Tax=Mangrovibacterium lignilyticum TaxID=2668052 RepID=UPI0013D8CF99|nr:histidine kinase N-terminal 7TM domain-containing protein [Mangrovibacterium lignilyticum]